MPRGPLNLPSLLSLSSPILLPGGSVSLPFPDPASERPPPTLSSVQQTEACPPEAKDGGHRPPELPETFQSAGGEKSLEGVSHSCSMQKGKKRESLQNSPYRKNRILEQRPVFDIDYISLCERLVRHFPSFAVCRCLVQTSGSSTYLPRVIPVTLSRHTEALGSKALSEPLNDLPLGGSQGGKQLKPSLSHLVPSHRSPGLELWAEPLIPERSMPCL